MKTINCDMCGEPIKMKVGSLFKLKLERIEEGFSTYPYNTSSDYIYERDYCKKCLEKIEFLIGLKKITAKKIKKISTTQRGKIVSTKNGGKKEVTKH